MHLKAKHAEFLINSRKRELKLIFAKKACRQTPDDAPVPAQFSEADGLRLQQALRELRRHLESENPLAILASLKILRSMVGKWGAHHPYISDFVDDFGVIEISVDIMLGPLASNILIMDELLWLICNCSAADVSLPKSPKWPTYLGRSRDILVQDDQSFHLSILQTFQNVCMDGEEACQGVIAAGVPKLIAGELLKGKFTDEPSAKALSVLNLVIKWDTDQQSVG